MTSRYRGSEGEVVGARRGPEAYVIEGRTPEHDEHLGRVPDFPESQNVRGSVPV
jgi:hypothetical protein